MRFPVIRERVRVQGRSGTFLVLSVDRTRGIARVTPTTGTRAEEEVPLPSILPLGDNWRKRDEESPQIN
jgi:hypothetical protein